MLTVVLDDDPTGTQSATDVEVLLQWDVADIVAILERDGSVYLQTNSRAISTDEATRLAETIRGQIRHAEQLLQQPILVVLRGDSTLRGHVFLESDVFAEDDGRILFVPAFPDGGRTTVDSVHRVVIDGIAVPVAETEFARDPVFSYRNSHLVEWVREKGDRVATPVSLASLRETDGIAVADALRESDARDVVVPDVETNEDLQTIYRGVLEALESGVRVVVRSGATLAAICAGRLSTSYLARPVVSTSGPVLVVCGSHTSASTAQLEHLLDVAAMRPVVVATDDAFDDWAAAGRRAAEALTQQYAERGLGILSSERQRRAEDDTLSHGELVMRALMTAAAAAHPASLTVVSKGGITSAEVAKTYFGAKRATVRGQIAAGISVWEYETDRGIGTQVVVPGNVGDSQTLVDALDAIGRRFQEQK